MRCLCPHCSQLLVQDRNESGINFCPNCQKLFHGIEVVPPWILGVLVVLMATWQIIYHH
jgi:ribosomal protein L37AE/L43A